MKRILTLVLVAMIGLVAVAVADDAKKEEAKPVTLTGEVLDMYCYMDHKATGSEHAKCATSCITKGLPVGFLASDGTVYLIIGKAHAPANAELAPFAGRPSTITGKVVENGGIKAIELISIAEAKTDTKG
jgi:hypothetical protein